MTTNPNNAVGTNGAYSGRTSPNALNDVLATFTGRGIISGWACTPDSGMDVTVGGNGTDRDVAIAEDNAGNKVTVNNISQSPVELTIPAAPANNSRIDSIVAYVENPPMGTAADTDNPGAVGLIVVSGTVASNPVPPSDNEIRTGITADGAAGSTAYYVTLANVTVPTGATAITNTNITAGARVTMDSSHIQDNAITTPKIANSAVTGEKLGITGEDIPLIFTVPNLFSQTETGKIFKFGKIGIITYNGTTGLSFGPGNLDHLQVSYDFTGMTNVYGGSLVYSQNNAPGCTMHFVRFFQGLVDAYLDTPSFENVDASLIIIVGLS